MSPMNMGVPSPLAEYKDVLISVVPANSFKINSERAVLNGSIVALSENQGNGGTTLMIQLRTTIPRLHLAMSFFALLLFRKIR